MAVFFSAIVNISKASRKDEINEKPDKCQVDRPLSRRGRTCHDNIRHLPRRDECCIHKGNQYLYGVYWNWITKEIKTPVMPMRVLPAADAA